MPKVSQVTERSIQSTPLQAPNMNLGTQQYQAVSNLGNTVTSLGKTMADAMHRQKMQTINTNNKSTLRTARADIQNAVTTLSDEYSKLRGEQAVENRDGFYKSINAVVKERMKGLTSWQREQLQINADAIAREGVRSVDKHHLAQTRVFDNESTERDIEAIKATAVANPTASNVLVQGIKLVDTWTAKYMREGLGAENANKRASEELSAMVTDMMIHSVQDPDGGGTTNASQIQDAMQAVEDSMNVSRMMNGEEPITVWQPDDKKRWNSVNKAYKDSTFASQAVEKAYNPDKSYKENLDAVKTATKGKDQKIQDEAVRRLELKLQQQKRVDLEEHNATVDEVEERMRSKDPAEAMTLSQVGYLYPDLELTKGDLIYLQTVEEEVSLGVTPKNDEQTYETIRQKMFDKNFMQDLQDPKLFARYLSKKDYAEFEEQWAIFNNYRPPKNELVKYNANIVKSVGSMMGFTFPIDEEGNRTADRDKISQKTDTDNMRKVHAELNYLAQQYKQVHGEAPSEQELWDQAKESGMIERMVIGEDQAWYDFSAEETVTGLDILTGNFDPKSDKAESAIYEQARKEIDETYMGTSTLIQSAETKDRLVLQKYIELKRLAREKAED